MDLIIDGKSVYKVKVRAEVFTVEYPSFEEGEKIAEEFADELNLTDKEYKDLMKKWLIYLGLDKKFLTMKEVKTEHILKVWRGVNTIKK